MTIGRVESRYVEELAHAYRLQAADLGVPPELIATDKIFTFQKNLREFCRTLHDGREVHYDSLYGTLDMIQLNVAVFERLAEERRRG